ncbi:MAG TPA: FAD binding domain-containing protein [Terriglobales bacterium]|jgi:xanthine dehydrogenase YagS FAD-binding subunit|nr:FAD binding domain-containing protein [Terriglobales bacterium]
MRAFDFATPTSKDQVSGLLGDKWGDVEILAGGTDLISLMKDDVTTPHRLVNIKGIKELRGVSVLRDGLRIGALMTLAEIAEDAKIKQAYPVLAEAANDAASPQIRNIATIGGNLCQRPRCWYFRSGHGLLAQGADGKSLVLEGDNRYHAILGNDGPAYFVSPSTVAPVLIAYQAKVRIQGSKATREVALENFFVIPKSEQEREHDLKPNEIVTEIVLPGKGPGSIHSAAYEVRQKVAFDWPYATAAVALTMNGGTVSSARVVLGHVAPVPWLSTEAAEALIGKKITAETADAAAKAAVAKAKSLGRNAEKIMLARVAVKRAILKAGGAA